MALPHLRQLSQPLTFKQRATLFRLLYRSEYALAATCTACLNEQCNEAALQFLDDYEDPRKQAHVSCGDCRQPLPVVLLMQKQAEHLSLPLLRRNFVMSMLLQERSSLSPQEFHKLYGDEFHWSLLFHFGSYRNAMHCRGVSGYPDSLVPNDWPTTVRPFLGTLPDGVIAHLVGVTGAAIQQLRRREQIPSFF